MRILVWLLGVYQLLVAILILMEGFRVPVVSENVLIVLIVGVAVFQIYAWYKVNTGKYD